MCTSMFNLSSRQKNIISKKLKIERGFFWSSQKYIIPVDLGYFSIHVFNLMCNGSIYYVLYLQILCFYLGRQRYTLYAQFRTVHWRTVYNYCLLKTSSKFIAFTSIFTIESYKHFFFWTPALYIYFTLYFNEYAPCLSSLLGSTLKSSCKNVKNKQTKQEKI